VQFAGSGPVRHIRLPGNTLQIRGQNVCASLKGLPFEPCFNLDKKDDRSFRGSVSGLGFAYCDFQHQGGATMLMARAVARPHARSTRTVGAAHSSQVTARVETPRVESSKIEPIRSEAMKPEPGRANSATPSDSKSEGAPELRRSTE
jgi:hypothetical protein